MYFVEGGSSLSDARAVFGAVVGGGAAVAVCEVEVEGRPLRGVLACEGAEGVLDAAEVRDWKCPTQGRQDAGTQRVTLLGVVGDGAPGPGELARGRRVDGHLVRLGDGRDWLVPCGRLFPSGTALPQTLVMEGGILRGEVVEEFAEYSRECEGLFWALYGDAMPEDMPGRPEQVETVTFERAFRCAVLALGVNYRVGLDEVSRLGLLRTDNVREVLGAMVDEPGLRRLAEKKTAS